MSGYKGFLNSLDTSIEVTEETLQKYDADTQTTERMTCEIMLDTLKSVRRQAVIYMGEAS